MRLLDTKKVMFIKLTHIEFSFTWYLGEEGCMARLRVLYLTNVPSPYRVDFFNELGRACDLTVLFEATLSGERHHRWHKYEFTNFEAVFLKGIKIRQDDALSMEVMRFLTRESFDVIVVGGYSTP